MNFLKIFSDNFQDNWDEPALTDFETGQTLTYGALAARMQRVHMILQGLGIMPGQRVAVVGCNSVDWVIAYMGALTYGACLVTLPVCDATRDSMMSMIGKVDVKVLFADPALIDEKTNYAEVPWLQSVISMDTRSILFSRSGLGKSQEGQRILDKIDEAFATCFPYGFLRTDARAPVVGPETVMAIFFTSGTLSAPRGVMLMADNLEGNLIYGMKTSLHPRRSAAVTSTTLGTVWGTIFDMMLPLASGAHLTVLKDVRNPVSLARAFMKVKPSRVMMSSLIMSRFYEYAQYENAHRPLARILGKIPGWSVFVNRMMRGTVDRLMGGCCQEVLVGNTALGASLAYKLKKAGVKLTVVYGLTECGGLVGYIPHAKYTPGTMGRPINSLIKCRIKPYPVPGFPEGTGILEVRGMTVMKGYVGDPRITEAVMTGDGWLSTGDLATITPHGDIVILGRRDSLIRLDRGVVAPERIETLLYSHAEVAHAIVVKRDNGLTAIIHPSYPLIEALHGKNTNIEHFFDTVVADINRQTSLLERINSVEISDKPLKLTTKGTVARYLYQK